MKKLFVIVAAVAVASVSCCRQESMAELTDRVFERAAVQFALLDSNMSPLQEEAVEPLYPRTVNPDGSLRTSGYKWWCSGFYPGSLWLVYEYTGDEKFKDMALKYQAGLEPLRYRTDDHDVGFQLMCSYGNCLRLTGDESCIPVLVDGANSLATRFDPEAGCTRSWNNDKWEYPVIIDNMMNLELMLKAIELGGPESLREVSLTHARTTMKNHYRPDFSSYHLVNYNPETGEILGKQTVQGLADESAWSRGQAWGLYGYTMVHRLTGEQDMLDHAVAVAEYLLPRLPEDMVPFWDFDSPDIPDDVRDASAGAVMASAFIELSTFVDAEKSARYLDAAEKMLRALASEEYLAAEGEQQGFLLKHSTGFKLNNSEVDAPLTYADYYFLEALLRWRALGK